MKNWTEADFQTMTWHDNFVHGVEFRHEENVFGTLVLDLDYIEEWLPPVEGKYQFRVTPCSLEFHNVTNLIMNLDYKHATAALCPFTIDRITRERNPEGATPTSASWEVEINWPMGRLSFDATGYTQSITGATIQSGVQGLDYKTRQEAMKSLNPYKASPRQEQK